jgi:hypothetical protein
MMILIRALLALSNEKITAPLTALQRSEEFTADLFKKPAAVLAFALFG